MRFRYCQSFCAYEFLLCSCSWVCRALRTFLSVPLESAEIPSDSALAPSLSPGYGGSVGLVPPKYVAVAPTVEHICATVLTSASSAVMSIDCKIVFRLARDFEAAAASGPTSWMTLVSHSIVSGTFFSDVVRNLQNDACDLSL